MKMRFVARATYTTREAAEQAVQQRIEAYRDVERFAPLAHPLSLLSVEAHRSPHERYVRISAQVHALYDNDIDTAGAITAALQYDRIEDDPIRLEVRGFSSKPTPQACPVCREIQPPDALVVKHGRVLCRTCADIVGALLQVTVGTCWTCAHARREQNADELTCGALLHGNEEPVDCGKIIGCGLWKQAAQ